MPLGSLIRSVIGIFQIPDLARMWWPGVLSLRPTNTTTAANKSDWKRTRTYSTKSSLCDHRNFIR